jgi:hypothetical protein
MVEKFRIKIIIVLDTFIREETYTIVIQNTTFTDIGIFDNFD